MLDKFHPTHVMTVGGNGLKRQRYKVRVVEKNGDGLYNVIFSPRSSLYREGIHFANGVPERSLKEIKKC